MTYGFEIARTTFKNLEDKGIGVPLPGIIFKLPPMLSKAEQDSLKVERDEFLKESGYERKRKRGATGLGLAQSAFLRALDVRGFDISDYLAICKGDYIVSFKTNQWCLIKNDKVLHSQLYGAGSIKIIDKYCKV